MDSIRVNWIGNLVSEVTEIQFDDSSLQLLNGSVVFSKHDLADISGFPQFNKGFFGSKIIFSDSKGTRTIRFLNSKKLEHCKNKLNCNIASLIVSVR